MELGSVDQAKDLVKFYQNQPLSINGHQVDFQMSHTFSFLQVRLHPQGSQVRTILSCRHLKAARGPQTVGSGTGGSSDGTPMG